MISLREVDVKICLSIFLSFNKRQNGMYLAVFNTRGRFQHKNTREPSPCVERTVPLCCVPPVLLSIFQGLSVRANLPGTQGDGSIVLAKIN